MIGPMLATLPPAAFAVNLTDFFYSVENIEHRQAFLAI